MSETAQPAMPPLYRAIEPLDKERHASLGLKRDRVNYNFAAETSAVPLNAPEFNMALKTYPIVFSSPTEPHAIAVLGLQQGQNLFIEPDGRWMQGAYIPSYVRRYPFIFGNTGDDDQFAFCVDTGADMISDKPDVPFFEDGELSEAGKQGVEACQVFQQQTALSQKVMEDLGASGLLVQREAKIRMKNGSERVLGNYIGIDEEELEKLSDEKFLELRRNNVLPFIYMHLLSLSNWMRLLDLHLVRNSPDEASPSVAEDEMAAPDAT